MNALPDYSRLSLVVVGDAIADRHLRAEPARLSREAPVMVLRHRGEELGPGGAANVALNLRALGARVALLSAVGRDANGRELLARLESEGVDVSGVEIVAGRVTPTKTRVLAAEPRRSPQQVLRIDREPEGELEPEVRERLAAALRVGGASADAVLLSDYEYGVLERETAAAARAVARAGRPIVLDPRRRGELFGDLRAWTPNVGELARFAGVDAGELDQAPRLVAAAERVRAAARCTHLVVTRGNQGAVLFDDEHPRGAWLPASGESDVTDPSGAGDTFAALFTASLAAGCDALDALTIANAAAGIVVMENGAVPCRLVALRAALPGAPRPVPDHTDAGEAPRAVVP